MPGQGYGRTWGGGRGRGRRRYPRFVGSLPGATLYAPYGTPLSMLEIVTLTVEEFEAIRLSDLEGLDQESAANRMGISRKAYWTDLHSGRKKIAYALTRGAAIEVKGGDYILYGKER